MLFAYICLPSDADSVCKWIPLNNGLELEVSLTQGHEIDRRRSNSLFKSFSFLRDKEKDKNN